MRLSILLLTVLFACSSTRSDLERSAYVGFDDIAQQLRMYVEQNDAISEARAIAIKVCEETQSDPDRYRAIPVLTDLQVDALRLQIKAFERLVTERLAADAK